MTLIFHIFYLLEIKEYYANQNAFVPSNMANRFSKKKSVYTHTETTKKALLPPSLVELRGHTIRGFSVHEYSLIIMVIQARKPIHIKNNNKHIYIYNNIRINPY